MTQLKDDIVEVLSMAPPADSMSGMWRMVLVAEHMCKHLNWWWPDLHAGGDVVYDDKCAISAAGRELVSEGRIMIVGLEWMLPHKNGIQSARDAYRRSLSSKRPTSDDGSKRRRRYGSDRVRGDR